MGGSGYDDILADEGDDILIGEGGDTLIGEGGDIGLDTIDDFVLGTDSIDIDLLVEGLGGDLSMKVDADGSGTFEGDELDLSITLEGVSLSQSEIESIFADYTVVDDGVI